MPGVERPISHQERRNGRTSSLSEISILATVQCLGFLLGAAVVYVLYFKTPAETAAVRTVSAEQPAQRIAALPVRPAPAKPKPAGKVKWSVASGKQDRLEASYEPMDEIAGEAISVVFQPVLEPERTVNLPERTVSTPQRTASTQRTDSTVNTQPRTPPVRLAGHRPLSRFFAELAALEAGTRTEPITVVHLGDSHIASDSLSRGIRKRLQTRFGDAGRGMMVPAGAYKYAIADGVSFKRLGHWQASNSLRAKTGPYGVSGVRLTTNASGARLSLTSRRGLFDWAEVTVVTGPKQGTVQLKAGSQTMSFNARADERGSKVVRITARAETFTVTAGPGGATTVLNWAVGRERPGIRYVNFGIAGATADITKRWADQLVANDIAHLKPDLIVWGYGTNEGFNDGLDLARYRNTVSGFISQLKQAAPQADFLFLGPADGARSKRHARGSRRCAPGNWSSPPKLYKVRQLLKDLSKAENAAYWDWYEAMGGACSINRWASATPALAARDRVHLTPRGYERSADLFVDHLMKSYSQSLLVAATQ